MALSIIRERYSYFGTGNDFSPTLDCEKLLRFMLFIFKRNCPLVDDPSQVVGQLVNTSMSGITLMGIKNSGLMVYHFPTPLMTSFPKSTRVQAERYNNRSPNHSLGMPHQFC